ncbi:MAG TPA: hypothetical protein VF228_17590 [Iamia sp.]
MTVRRTTSLLASAALCAGALALVPSTAGGQAPTCEQPYSPGGFARTYPQAESVPAPADATLVSEPIDSSQAPVDMDGDGTDDTQLVDPFTLDVRITRGDGVLDLDAGGADFTATDGLGDLDGDGRDELGIQIDGGSDPGSYVVPGSTPVGATTVVAAGIRIADGEPLGTFDGSDRLLIVGTDTDVVAASAVMDAGPGGDARGVPVTATAPGRAVTRADLGAGPAVILTVVEDGTRSLVTVLGADVVTLTTAPEPFLASSSGAGAVDVLSGTGGAYVVLSNSQRSGAYAYIWSLERPCGPLLPGAAPPPPATAPPAQPVDAEAAFTG